MRYLSLLLVSLLGACYTYAPVEPGVPERTANVRVQLSTPRAFELGEIIVQNVSTVEGEVITWGDEALALSATQLRSVAGQDFLGRGLTVHIPVTDIAGVQEKRIAPARTGLVAGAGVLLAVLGGALATGSVGGGDGPGRGGQTK